MVAYHWTFVRNSPSQVFSTKVVPKTIAAWWNVCLSYTVRVCNFTKITLLWDAFPTILQKSSEELFLGASVKAGITFCLVLFISNYIFTIVICFKGFSRHLSIFEVFWRGIWMILAELFEIPLPNFASRYFRLNKN